MLPATKSSRADVVAQLVDLRARFHGWLHQDEFGPRRGEQTATLRAHIKFVRELCQRLNKGKSRSRDRLDAALRRWQKLTGRIAVNAAGVPFNDFEKP